MNRTQLHAIDVPMAIPKNRAVIPVETPFSLPTFSAAKFDRQFLYLIVAVPSGFYKIGIAQDPESRLRDLQVAHYEELRLCFAIKCCCPTRDLEMKLHLTFAERCKRGEWFQLDDEDLALLGMIVVDHNTTRAFPKPIAPATDIRDMLCVE